MTGTLRERLLLPTATFFALVGAWHVAVLATGATVFPSPAEVLRGVGELARRGVLFAYVADSLRRVALGYGAAVLAGIPVGLLLGSSRTLSSALNPLMQMLRPISPLAWMPLAVVWFGISDAAPVFLIFMGAFFPIVVAAMNGMRGIPKMYVQAGRNFGLRGFGLIERVILPAILPRVITGLRIALGIAWIVLVASEMIAVDSGLGYLIIDARNAGKRYDLVVAGMLMIGIVGLLLDLAMRQTEKLAIVRWAFRR